MDYIEKDEQQHQDEDGNGFWNFKHIVGHEGSFRASNPECKGSRYNIFIEWENGEITSEPLNIFGKDDPVTLLSMLASTDYLKKKDGNDSRELRNVKRRCFVWSTSLLSRRLTMHQGTNSAIISLAITMKSTHTNRH
jgi:hypothetical protein